MAKDKDEELFDEENDDSDFEGDEEDELEEEDEEEQEQQQRKKPAKKRKGAEFFDEVAEEDDDEDEDEGGGGRKRKKASRFIDDIADVDDEEEEEEADEEIDDMLAHNDEDLDAEDIGGGGAAARYRELELMRQNRREQTEEEMAKYLEEKYREADYDDEDDYDHYGEEEDVGQQGLQPTKEDPGLFMVTCRIGSEREACLQLLQKCYDLAERGTPLQIKSAVCLDHLKGFFYVEAFRDSHVLEAIRGLRTIYAGKGARLVPLKERAAAITVNRQAKAAIERDSWVRVRGGLYKDDLAKVVDVDFAAGRALIKLVPRLDLSAMAKDMSGGRRNPFGRQAVRPPQKPFRAKEAGELGLPVGKDRNDPAVITLNTHRFIDGYTLRNYTLKGLILQDTAPPLDEISRFNQAGQSDLEDTSDPTAHLQQLLKSMPDGSAPKATYVKGDRVLVTGGDLATLQGTVEDVRKEDGKLLVRPDILADQVVELELHEVQKLFQTGDYVRVLSGQHAGERGMVVKLVDGMCVLMPDSRQGELKVFAKDLTEATETGTGIETLGGKYSLHDLVQLDASTAGVIIGIDKDIARVLTNHSTPQQPDVRICKETDILRKMQTNRMSAQDGNNAVINTGDYVILVDPLAGLTGQGAAKKETGGTVHAISRGSLFLKSTESGKSGGFLVVRSKQVRLRGSTLQQPIAPGVGFGGSSALKTPGHTPGASPQHLNGSAGAGRIGAYGGYGGGGRGGGRGRGHGSHLIGTEVVVRSGAYARYKGRIKQETSTHLQLELDAINKTVMVKKEDVFGKVPGGGPPGGFFGGRGGGFQPGRGGGFNPAGVGGFTGPPRTPAHVMQTPMHPSQGGATPVHPSRTPMHPSQTPMHPSMTPMHPSMTPMHPGMTPRHPSSEPDWVRGPSAATPGGYGDLGAATVNTPGGYGGYGPAPTPGTAETPGTAGYADPGNARTPGAMAATPGDAYGHTAYTPGGYIPAATPGGGQDMIAPSPAGGDPYYMQPTPGMGQTPGTVATPGMVTGYTPMGGTPGMAYTPGIDGGVSGMPGTPGVGLMPGMDGMGAAAMGQLPPQQQARRPDYRDVLVKLPDGRVGVGGESRADGSLEVTALDTREVVVVDTVELVPVEKKDKVKVVVGDKMGKIGEVMTFDGGDAVLMDADVVDRTWLGKLHR